MNENIGTPSGSAEVWSSDTEFRVPASPERAETQSRPEVSETRLEKAERLADEIADTFKLPKASEIVDVFFSRGHGVEPEIQRVWQDLIFKRESVTSQVYEVFTQEYIEQMSRYLGQRIEELHIPMAAILEVPGGNGKLSYFLRQSLQDSLGEDRFNLFSLDKSTHIPAKSGAYVESGPDYKYGLSKYKPDIIVTSWMPLGVDWPRDYRNVQNLKEYILIGERAVCGTPGVYGRDEDGHTLAAPEYQRDGFGMRYLNLGTQICRSDVPEHGLQYPYSSTISFERV